MRRKSFEKSKDVGKDRVRVHPDSGAEQEDTSPVEHEIPGSAVSQAPEKGRYT
jgi:hypothetical protein